MGVPGLKYIAGYVAEPDEGALLAAIDAQPWLLDLKRRVQHYGYRYDYKARKVDSSMYLGPLPAWRSRWQRDWWMPGTCRSSPTN